MKMCRILSSIPLFALGWGCGSDVEEPQPRSALVVSQILYRNQEDSLEWIELRNDGADPADLSEIEIKGAGFRFPASAGSLVPGGRIVLTNSGSLFARYHPGVPIGGVFSGRLADEGERIRVVSPGGDLFSLAYGSLDPWPEAAGRFGSSLVYLGGDPADPHSWAASRKAGGQPLSPTETAVDKGVWISEIRPADDAGNGFIELASTASQDVDLSGWILAPEAGGSRYDTLPAGTSIPAGGRIVLRQSPGPDERGWGRQAPKPTEDRIFLAEADKDGTRGSAHSLGWSYVPTGMSVGRVGSFLDGGDPVLLATPTPGRPDPTRSIGAVSISEVCVSPSASEAEFVELENETDSVVHLGHFGDTLRSWRLSGTGKVFHETDSLLPRKKFVLVNQNETTVETFRAKWSIPTDVGVAGFSGRLDDAGETLELLLPVIPDAKQGGRWLERVVDAVGWRAHAPWPPTIFGGGDCLARADKAAAGTSPKAWVGSKPTPGR